MSGHELAGWLAAGLGAMAFIPGIKAILEHRWQPNPVSWGIWAVIDIISFSTSYAKGAGSVLWQIGIYTLGALIITPLSLRPPCKWSGNSFDLLAGAGAISSILLWLLLKSPSIGLAFSLVAFLFGAIPTFKDAWRRKILPSKSERQAWLLFACSSTTNLLAVEAWSWTQWEKAAFAVMSAICNTFLFLLIIRPTNTTRRPSFQA